MRTNIVIDEALMAAAMKAGPYKTKKDAVEAGLKLLARQAAYREILKWEGKLKWDGEPWVERDMRVDERTRAVGSPAQPKGPGKRPPAKNTNPGKRTHGRR